MRAVAIAILALMGLAFGMCVDDQRSDSEPAESAGPMLEGPSLDRNNIQLE